ncbi:hypothetical protein AVEN_29403-1 [Araneus ventricosus]|uniref:Uncharacterized protein n=1 Tax=Araneus ventricosus TaxID=182803 RepID=A0A4Y2XCT9_ARAVE|nr:hypothetical protein AVEN_29403-1 [Araneus ventricosus]
MSFKSTAGQSRIKESVSVHADSGQRIPVLVISRVAGVRHGVDAFVKAAVFVPTDSAQRFPILMVSRVVKETGTTARRMRATSRVGGELEQRMSRRPELEPNRKVSGA